MLTLLATGVLGTPALAKPFFDTPPPSKIRYTPESAAALRQELYDLMGVLPPRDHGKHTRYRKRSGTGTYSKRWRDLNSIEMAPAFLARPENGVPAVLFNHSHGGGYDIGKKEFVEGRNYLQDPPYAKVITNLGCIGLCFDTWVFGERAHTPEQDMFKAMLWQDRVLWGMMVYDSIKAVDYLVSRDDVDASRIGTLGISMGSTMAWWLAALDERIAVTVDICCLTDLHTFLHNDTLAGHGIYYYVPGLLNHFSTSDINALIAPRPHLALAGLQDKLTPPEGLDIIEANLNQVYAACGKPENWKLLRYNVGHQETPEGRREITAFLQKHLS